MPMWRNFAKSGHTDSEPNPLMIYSALDYEVCLNTEIGLKLFKTIRMLETK